MVIVNVTTAVRAWWNVDAPFALLIDFAILWVKEGWKPTIHE